MLNRRILRIKCFKELFAIEMLPNPTLAKASKELDTALESTRDLYLFMLDSVCALTAVARQRMEQLSRKINKTEDEKNPNLKFVNNNLSVFFESEPSFQKILKKKGLSWGAYDLILQKIYASIQSKDYFAEYMADPQSSLAADCKLFARIFEDEFVGREDLELALEDLNIYWNDDLPYALTCCCKALETIGKTGRWAMPELFLSNGRSDMADDKAYVHTLLKHAVGNYPEYYAAISEAVPNWDKDRLVGTDIAIIVTALSEIVAFPDIPLNVTINEYVEISKYFGTPKSSIFVNGILDSLSKKVEFQK